MFRWRKRFKPGVTAAIPTCGRPAKLRKCVEACLADGLVERVLVWNSAPNPCERLSRFAVEFPALSVIEAGRLIGPGEARYQLAGRVETEFLFFSDDSKYADAGAIAEMMRLMRLHDDVDILLGAQRNVNDGKWRDLAQHIAFGRLGEERTVHKTFTWPQDLDRLGLDMIVSDIPSSQMLARTAVFERVNFDPRYDFWFELYDFGMQCVTGGGSTDVRHPSGDLHARSRRLHAPDHARQGTGDGSPAIHGEVGGSAGRGDRWTAAMTGHRYRAMRW